MNEEVTAVENKNDEETSLSACNARSEWRRMEASEAMPRPADGFSQAGVSETEEEVTQQESPEGIPSEDEVTQFQEEINIVKTEVAALKDVLNSKATTESLQVVKEQMETLGLSAKRIETLDETVQERLKAEVSKRDEFQKETEMSLDDLTTGFEGLNKTVREIVNVVKPKDEAARTINPAAVPPVVLQEAYENIATDVFQQMVKQHGSTAAVSKVEATVEYVRRSSAGMEFFKVSDNQRITAPGLANAIRQKLMSAHQIQITFTEFLRKLVSEVPDYKPLSLRSLTETGSQEYAVSEVTKLVEQTVDFGDSLSAIQNSLEETNANIEALSSRIEKLESAVTLKK